MQTLSAELLRIDPLTECQNFLGFLEACLNLSPSGSPGGVPPDEIIETLAIDLSQFSAILMVDLNDFTIINETKGRVYGDSVLHWMGILLREECDGPVFRVMGDEFAVLLKMDTRAEHSRYLESILERINREAKSLDFPEDPADIALILYDQSFATLDAVLLQMEEAMGRVKNEATRAMIFYASDLKLPAQVPPKLKRNTFDASHAAWWATKRLIKRVLEMGKSLDQVQQDAYTDAISGLPNMRAALLNLEHSLKDAIAKRKPFSIMMIDGDNLRAYNNINYAAGDGMIRDMSAVFQNHLRPDDFLARWRTGDEFLVILPDTPIEGARIIGERFRLAIKETSKSWRFPVTISTGVASYPRHGDQVDILIDVVEAANKRAKDQGKDQVVLADYE